MSHTPFHSEDTEETPEVSLAQPIAPLVPEVDPETVAVVEATQPKDLSGVDTQEPVVNPEIATTQSSVQQTPLVEEVAEEITALTEEKAEVDISMFSDVTEGEPDEKEIQEFGIHSLFSEVDGDATVLQLEDEAKATALSDWEAQVRRKEAKISDAPIELQTDLLDNIVGKKNSKAVSHALTTSEYINEHGGAVGLADRLAGHGLRGIAGVLDFVTAPVSWAMGKVPGVQQPSFLQTLEYYFPAADYEFKDAPDLLVDDALRVAGVGMEFAAGGVGFAGALATTSKVAGILASKSSAATKGFSVISDDILFTLPSQISFDTLSGSAYQSTKELLGEDSEAAAIMTSLLFPLIATRDGRGLLILGGKKGLSLANKASDYTLVAPLLKKAGGNYLDNKATQIARESSANPEAFSKGLSKWKKKVSENWIAKRVSGIDDAMVAENARVYFKEIINFKDARVLERQSKVIKVENEINTWRKASGSIGLPEFQMPVYVAYRGVTDNAALEYLEITYKQSFPELHLKATRDRLETVQEFVKSKGEQASEEDVALLRGLTQELSGALDDRIAREATALLPTNVIKVDDVLVTRKKQIATAGSLRKSIENIDNLTDDAYVAMLNKVDTEVPLDSGTILKAIDDIIATDAQNILRSKAEVPSYVIEVYQGVKAARPDAKLSPTESRLNAIDVEKRDLDIRGADANQAALQELSGFDAAISSKTEDLANATVAQQGPIKLEITSLKKERALSVANHKKETAINTAKKKPLIAEQRGLELKVKQEKLALGTTDQVALLADMVPVNSGEVMSSIKRVNRLIREEFRAISPDTGKLDNLQKIKSSLQDTMGQLEAQGTRGAATLEQWEQANSFYKNQISDKMDATVIGTKYLKKTKDGKNFHLYDEDVVSTAWDKANIKDIDDTLRLATDTKDLKETLRSLDDGDVLLEDLSAQTVKLVQDYRDLGVSSLMKELTTVDNTLGSRMEDPARYMEAMKKSALSWLDVHAAKIERVPGLKTEIDRILGNNEEFFQRISKYNELVATREGPEIKALLKSMGHSDNIRSIIKDNESSNALATAIEGLITEGYATPSLKALAIPELDQFQQLLGIQGSHNFKELLAKQYKSSVWDGDTFNAQAVRNDLDNPSTRANLEKVIGEENVLALDVLSDALLLSGIDDSVKTSARIASGEKGIVGAVLDSALTVVSNNQQKLSSLGSLALRRARGFAPSAEWFQVYLGTTALKYLGAQGSSAYVKSVIENHRKLGNIDKALSGLANASNSTVVNKILSEGLPWSNLPRAFRNDSALALRRVIQAVGLHINHQDAMAIVEKSIQENGGRTEPKKTKVPKVPEVPQVPLNPQVPEELGVPDVTEKVSDL